MKKLFMACLFLFISLPAGFLFATKVEAYLYSEYPNYNVDIVINKDGTMNITEQIDVIFSGELNGVRRDITLYNPSKYDECLSNPDLTCGGFDFLMFNYFKLEDKILDESEYDLYDVTDDFGNKFFRIEKRLHNPAETVEDERWLWEINYDVVGGIQWLSNSKGARVPFFYWNLFPENRSGIFENATVTLHFPPNVDVNLEELLLYTLDKFRTTFDEATNSVTLKFEDLSTYSTITASYEFEDQDLDPTGEIQFNFVSPLYNVNTYFDSRKISANQDNTIRSVPVGEHELEFSRVGYKNEVFELNISANEIEKIDVTLEPTLWMAIIKFLGGFLFTIGLLLIPYAPYYVYKKYQRKGRDINMPKTIIPQYRPIDNMRPYLMGSLKDEKVDNIDITGSIIDLAYRGFLKIKELDKGKDFELTKLVKEDTSDKLNPIEEKIMYFLFASKDSVKISTIGGSTSKVLELHNLRKAIYKEMVSLNFFEKDPSVVRNLNLGAGFGLAVLGIALSIVGSIALIFITGIPLFVTIGIPIFVWGIGLIIISQFMPAKTEIGSKAFADVLGFKMYLETAERFRVQNLDPDEFMKFLSYAIIFGVEKKWAENFKDVYKENPSWYEGSGTILANPVLFSNSLRSFNNKMGEVVRPFTSNSASGKGWSGGGFSGGSFGGFSGGGGGGGSVGGW